MGTFKGPLLMQITKELIERYHQGRCHPNEKDAVEKWLESDEQEMSFPAHADLTAMEDKGWKRISARYEIPAQAIANKPLKLNNYPHIWQFAACFLLLVGLGTTYYLNHVASNSHQAALIYKTVRTLKGQKLQVKLSDGTLVWLNSESVLRFPESFKGNLRTLQFSGEAYFDVAKDPSKPFIIHTAKTKVKVLGTRFNLRALAAEKATSVVVEEGKVKFIGQPGKQETILTANRRGIFEVSPVPVMMAQGVSAGQYIAWKNNELLLDNLTIEEVAQTLERWYDVDIKINRADLAQERYTGDFKNPTLKQVLESMSFAVKFNYRQEKQTFIFY